jgi:hypothetical protein
MRLQMDLAKKRSQRMPLLQIPVLEEGKKMITAVRKVTREEAVKYLIPALRELNKLAVPYEVGEEEIVIKIPKFLPIEK